MASDMSVNVLAATGDFFVRRDDQTEIRQTVATGWLQCILLSGRDDGMGAAVGDRVVAFTCVIGTVGGDAFDLLVSRDLVEQVR